MKTLSILFLYTLFLVIKECSQDKPLPKNTIGRYRKKLKILRNISEVPPIKNKSIFFLETSWKSYYRKKLVITAREACAVESAALLNPNLNIYLLYSAPGILKFDESDKLLRALFSYKNVNIMHLDVEKFAKGTPIAKLLASRNFRKSHHLVAHTSDALRLILLWKYGGIYLDLDVVVMKSFSDLPMNFAGVEEKKSVANGVLSFDARGIGHTLAEKCLNDLKVRFDGKSWAKNGPGILTRVLQTACDVNLPKNMVGKYCKGFTVYPYNKFYPISVHSWETLFHKKYLKDILNKTKDSYTLHLWNHISGPKKIPLSAKKVPYLFIASKFCPKVVKAIRQYF